MKNCLILTGGTLDLDFAGDFCRKNKFDLTIAVDGGLAAAKALGILPDVVVGDLDTAGEGLVEEFRQYPFIRWDVHPPEKDETDTELALRRAIAGGAGKISILGATGGRFDHMLANVFLLYGCLQKGVEACILDRQNRIFLIEDHYTFHKDQLWGKYVSFLPLLGEIRGITLEGFKYPLQDYDLEAASSRCISNELTEESGTIRFQEGIAICVEARE